jgi:nucleoside-diphosphate-sugar epimerase
MNRVLVTGATGFVGRAVLPALAPVAAVRAAVRDASAALPAGVERVAIGSIGRETDWRAALDGVDAVVHLAARVHVMRPGPDDEALCRQVNVAGTLRLAEAAAASGVSRFVFVSTVKVMGDRSQGRPFTEDDAPAPVGPYAISKLLAERALAAFLGPAVTILRPPLVYGPGVKGNFRALQRLAASGLPLPLGSVANRRSLLYVGNLADAIRAALLAPPAPGCRAYLLRDGEDLSTADLLRRLAPRARLLRFPPALLARLLPSGLAERLLFSLAVDDSRFRRDHGWTPPFTVDQGLAATVAAPGGPG